MDSPEPEKQQSTQTPIDKRSPTEISAADAQAQALIDRLGRYADLRGLKDFGFDSEAGIGKMIDSFFELEQERIPEMERNRSSDSGFSSFGNLPMLGRINESQTRLSGARGRAKAQAYPGFWQSVMTDFQDPYQAPQGKLMMEGQSTETGAEGPGPLQSLMPLIGTVAGTALGGPIGGMAGGAMFGGMGGGGYGGGISSLPGAGSIGDDAFSMENILGKWSN